jgi:hypothetical protein
MQPVDISTRVSNATQLVVVTTAFPKVFPALSDLYGYHKTINTQCFSAFPLLVSCSLRRLVPSPYTLLVNCEAKSWAATANGNLNLVLIHI